MHHHHHHQTSHILIFHHAYARYGDSDDVVGIITASDIIKAFRTTDINPALEGNGLRKVEIDEG